MTITVLHILLASLPTIVIAGVLSTFEPAKTLLTDGIAVAVVVLAGTARLFGVGTVSLPWVGWPHGDRGRVWWVAVVGFGTYLVVTLIGTIQSVSPNTTWLGSLGRGQGNLFLLALAVIFLLDDLRAPRVVGTALRTVAIAGVPVALATLLQRVGLDPISRVLCDAERLPTTIGNALPGATFLGVATLLGAEALRHAWVAWRLGPPDAPPMRTEAISVPARRRPGRRTEAASAVVAAEELLSPLHSWRRPALLIGVGLLALFGGMAVAGSDLSRTWVAIPLALVWGVCAARAVASRPVVAPGLAVATWAAVVSLLSIANGLTLSRGPLAAFVAGAGVWVVACAFRVPGRPRISATLAPTAIVAGAVLSIGIGWTIPAIGCTTGASASTAATSAVAKTSPVLPALAPAIPTPATVATPATVPGSATTSAPETVVATGAPFDVVLDRLRAVLGERLNLASLGWRENVWQHALIVFADRPAPTTARERAMAAALAGAQYGDVTSLNALPEGRPRGSVWYQLFGYGPESQVFVLASNASPRIRAVQGEITYDRAHNIVLDILLTNGVVGLIAWVVMSGAVMVLAWRLRRQVAEGVVGPALAPVLTCLLVSGVSGVDATTITMVSWFVTAVAILLPVDAVGPTRAPMASSLRGRYGDPADGGTGLIRLLAVGGLAAVVPVVLAVGGLGATLPASWAIGAAFGFAFLAYAVIDPVWRRGTPDTGAMIVIVVTSVATAGLMWPAWTSLTAGHYARLGQDVTLDREVVTAYGKKAVSLDPGQATYRVLAGS